MQYDNKPRNTDFVIDDYFYTMWVCEDVYTGIYEYV